MTEETYMGAPRSKIPWYPTIDKEKCNQCEGDPQCLKFCPHGVFEFNKEKKEFIVKNPNNCVVFCRSCRTVCAVEALGFPDKKEILKVIKDAREKSPKYIIIPCSGIGKALGTITRRATYIVTEELLPNATESICLPLLTIKDKETVQKIRNTPCITVDGCIAQCAKKNVEHHGGKLRADIKVLDIMKENKGLKPGTVLDIGPEGEKLARKTAEKVAKTIGDLN